MHFKKKLGLFCTSGGLLLLYPLLVEEKIVHGSHIIELEESEIEENLELPDFYENTLIYNGTVNPDLNFWIEMPWHEPSSGPGEEPEGLETPFVNDVGHFALSFVMDDLQAGDEIAFVFNAPESDPYRRSIEVQPAEEGMEIVESNADTSEVQQPIIDATSFDWQEQENAILLDIETVGDVESAPFYTVNDEPITLERRLEHIQDNLNRARFTHDSINIGDIITVYVVASGVTTPVEVEVPDSLTSLQNPNEEEPVEDEDIGEDIDSDEPDGESDVQNDDVDEAETNQSNLDVDDTGDVESAETTSEETEATGHSIAWIVGGIIVGVAIIAGIIYGLSKRKR